MAAFPEAACRFGGSRHALLGVLALLSMLERSASVASGLVASPAQQVAFAGLSSQPAAACPAGTVQVSPVVFDCSRPGVDLHAKYLALAGKTDTVFEVPVGVTDFKVSLSVQAAGSKLELDVLGNGKPSMESTSGAIDDVRTSRSEQGPPITNSGSQATVTGSTSSPLSVQVRSRDVYPQELTLTYSYTAVQDCDTAKLASCKRTHALAVSEAVADWGHWVQEKYNGNVEAAWQGQAGPMVEAGPGGDIVPGYKWSYVWNSWPLSHGQGISWEDAFAYLSKSKGYVDKSDLSRAFNLNKVKVASDTCLERLLEVYSTKEAAWQVMKSASGQAQFLTNCTKLTGQNQDALRAFMFATDGQGALSEAEFQVLWDQLNKCPKGHYRTSPIVFHCHSTSGHAKFYVRGRMTEVLSEIPKGVVNLRIGINADQDADLMLYDAASKTWVAKWDGGVVNRDRPTGAYAGVQLTLSGDRRQVDGTSLVEEFLETAGILQSPLKAEVNNFGSTDASVMVSYSWDGIEAADCPDVPVGCVAFDEPRARSALRSFSSWAAKQYGTKEQAWHALREGLPRPAPGSQLAQVEGVPFYEWEGIWQKWPSHHAAGVSWQEAFHLVDSNEDNVVSLREFHHLLQSHLAQVVLQNMLLQVAEHYPEASDAWKAMEPAGNAISSQQWAAVIDDFVNRGTLPGGDEACQPWPAMPPYTVKHEEALRVVPSMETSSQSVRLGQAESLGVVGGSFTALARVWIGPIVESGEPDVETVFSSLEPMDSSKEQRFAAFMGFVGRKPSMGFDADGSSACTADEEVPAGEWMDVAWTYDSAQEEMRVRVNGRTVQACPNVAAFQGFGQQVWAGVPDRRVSSWNGRISSLFLFPDLLSDKDTSHVFRQSPRIRQTSLDSFSGDNSEALYLGPADTAGLQQGGSFTVTLSARRSEAQVDSADTAYELFGTHEANGGSSTTLVALSVRRGALRAEVSGAVCQATSPFPHGRWVRVAFVFDVESGEQQLLQDGKLVKVCQASTSPGSFASEPALWLGRGGGGSEGGWIGDIKDFTVFDQSECVANIEALDFSASDVKHAPPSLVQSMSQDSFKSLDTDGNGDISEDEYEAALKWVTEPGDNLHPTEHPQSVPAPAPLTPVPPAPPVPPVPPVPAMSSASVPAPAPAPAPAPSLVTTARPTPPVSTTPEESLAFAMPPTTTSMLVTATQTTMPRPPGYAPIPSPAPAPSTSALPPPTTPAPSVALAPQAAAPAPAADELGAFFPQTTSSPSTGAAGSFGWDGPSISFGTGATKALSPAAPAATADNVMLGMTGPTPSPPIVAKPALAPSPPEAAQPAVATTSAPAPGSSENPTSVPPPPANLAPGQSSKVWSPFSGMSIVEDSQKASGSTTATPTTAPVTSMEAPVVPAGGWNPFGSALNFGNAPSAPAAPAEATTASQASMATTAAPESTLAPTQTMAVAGGLAFDPTAVAITHPSTTAAPTVQTSSLAANSATQAPAAATTAAATNPPATSQSSASAALNAFFHPSGFFEDEGELPVANRVHYGRQHSAVVFLAFGAAAAAIVSLSVVVGLRRGSQEASRTARDTLLSMEDSETSRLMP
eukprot:TRINITY_DN19030_c0_g1_i1.p1 TRINITY_DN19030_c0_g1~~TRINITY_DN19030_c0_g1_i1.p1  ORF type:complete len:1590 (+),score=360.62 TRINITY_DN19030_c0_g1_i1:81-4850(+)